MGRPSPGHPFNEGALQTVPTLHFPNGNALTNPTLAQVEEQLAVAG
jgi:hypothetical protein